MTRWQRLRRWLRENGWNLALSFAFTVLIMYLIDDELQESLPDVQVLIELEGPPGYLVTPTNRDMLNRSVTLRGPREELSKFAARELESRDRRAILITHDLDRDQLDQLIDKQRRSPEDIVHSTLVFRAQLAQKLPVEISIGAGAEFPWRVSFTLDKTQQVERPVQVEWKAGAKQGFRVKSISPLPPTVTLSGPQTILDNFPGPVKVDVTMPPQDQSFSIENVQVPTARLPLKVECADSFDVFVEIVPDDVWWTELAVHSADTSAVSPAGSPRRLLEVPMEVRTPLGLELLVLPHKENSPIYLNVKAPKEFLAPLSQQELAARIRAYFVLRDDDLTPTLRGPDNDRLTDEKQESLVYFELPPPISRIEVAVHPDGLTDQYPRNPEGGPYELLRERYRYELKEP